MDQQSTAEAVGSALAAIMSQQHRLALAALGDDGFRVPMPEYEELTGGSVVPPPPDRATMADLVVAEDRMTVVTTWEKARRYGVATARVRLLSDPSGMSRLTILDTRPQFGTWLAAVARGDGEATGPAAEEQWLPAPVRPRSATVRLDMFAVIRSVDDRATRMLGWAPEETVGVRSLEFCHPDDHQRVIDSWMQLLADKTVQRVRARRRCSDGSWLWVESELTYVDADNPDKVEVVAQLTDISAEMAAYEALHRREEVFRRLAESVPVGLVQATADGTVTYTNARVARILGLPGQRRFERLEDVFADQAGAAINAALQRALADGTDQELELTIARPGRAELRDCAISIVCLSGGEGQPEALICVNDVTEEALMRRELQERATFDPLTRCYNRASTMEAVESALRWQGAGKTGALFIDLDSFKSVNDRLGHAAGDQLLACVGERLADCVRGNDIVGRLGGDEFLVLCRDLSGPAPLMALAERAQRALAQPIILGGETVTVQASIGACYAEHTLTADELVARADSAMYESKRQGAGRLVLFGSVPALGTNSCSTTGSN